MKKLLLFALFLQISLVTHAMNYNAYTANVAIAAESLSDLKTLRSLNGDHNWPQRKKLIKLIIKKNPQNIDVAGYNKQTPLHECVSLSDIPFALYLFHHNANANHTNLIDQSMLEIDKTPLYLSVKNLDLNIQHAQCVGISREQIDLQKQMLKLLIINDADPDYRIIFDESPRNIASPKTQLLIKQAEREKQIREYVPLYPFITSHLPFNLTNIVTGYLGQLFHVAPTEIAQIKADIAAEYMMLKQEIEPELN